MATYEPYLYNLKKLKDDPSVDNSIFICPSLIDVPEKYYKNNGDVYMTNKHALYGVGSFVRKDVYGKEDSLITLNDLDDKQLPEESNKVDINMCPMISPNVSNTEYDKNNNTYTCKCFWERCVIKHNDILVKSCNITCVAISNSVYGSADAWGNGYNCDNHEVGKASLAAGNGSGYIYVKTSITKNNDEYTLFTSIKQTPWSHNSLSDTQIHITVYFTVDKGDGDETELNTKHVELLHNVAPSATAEYVRYDGKLIFKYEFDKTKKIFTGMTVDISYPKS